MLALSVIGILVINSATAPDTSMVVRQIVGVVAGMAPPPRGGVAHDHEGGDFVDGVVHPRRLEGRAVAAFMPARIRGGAIEDAIGGPERHAPP